MICVIRNLKAHSNLHVISLAVRDRMRNVIRDRVERIDSLIASYIQQRMTVAAFTDIETET